MRKFEKCKLNLLKAITLSYLISLLKLNSIHDKTDDSWWLYWYLYRDAIEVKKYLMVNIKNRYFICTHIFGFVLLS